MGGVGGAPDDFDSFFAIVIDTSFNVLAYNLFSRCMLMQINIIFTSN